MRVLYLSRHFNRSGYYIFEELLNTRKRDILGLVVPDVMNILDYPFISWLEIIRYRLETLWFRAEPCRFMKSIVKLARKNKIPVYFIKSVKNDEFYNLLKNVSPDLILLGGGWPELLPERVISFPRLGVINTHPSLLPEFRGGDVHRWQILKGVKESGVTIHYVDQSFDTGEIIGQRRVIVSQTDSPQQLFEKTAKISVGLMSEVLDKIEKSGENRVSGIIQEEREDKMKYFSKWNWADRNRFLINWELKAEEIYNLVRASHQESYRYIGPFISFGNKIFVLRKTALAENRGNRPGEIIAVKGNSVIVSCGQSDSSLEIIQIQKSSGNKNWRRGELGVNLIHRYGLKVGSRLG